MSPLESIPLAEFIGDYYDPRPGQHVALVGPNGCGKTTIAMQLLAKTTEYHPGLRGVALVMKPHQGAKPRPGDPIERNWWGGKRRKSGDETIQKLTRRLGGRIIRDWPPPPIPWRREPPFWSLWPKHTGDPDDDLPAHYATMRRCLLDCYVQGGSVVFADEAAGLSEDLKLDDEMKQTLQRGRSMDAGLILATQRPRYVPRAMFTESKHFFLWKMTDVGEYERVREIGGGQLTRQQIVAALQGLSKHQCLYLYPDADVACILS